jgi:hypothetical protein
MFAGCILDAFCSSQLWWLLKAFIMRAARSSRLLCALILRLFGCRRPRNGIGDNSKLSKRSRGSTNFHDMPIHASNVPSSVDCSYSAVTPPIAVASTDFGAPEASSASDNTPTQLQADPSELPPTATLPPLEPMGKTNSASRDAERMSIMQMDAETERPLRGRALRSLVTTVGRDRSAASLSRPSVISRLSGSRHSVSRFFGPTAICPEVPAQTQAGEGDGKSVYAINIQSSSADNLAMTSTNARIDDVVTNPDLSAIKEIGAINAHPRLPERRALKEIWPAEVARYSRRHYMCANCFPKMSRLKLFSKTQTP